jgi:hypothetical protein
MICDWLAVEQQRKYEAAMNSKIYEVNCAGTEASTYAARGLWIVLVNKAEGKGRLMRERALIESM